MRTSSVCGNEPIVVVRGSDNVLRGFFNVCRHHAAAVMEEPEGEAKSLRCPYHGWTYALDGQLKGTPDFAGVCNFDRAEHGLMPVQVAEWENWVFVKLDDGAPSLEEFLGDDLIGQIRRAGGKTVVLVEHNMSIVMSVSDQITVMHQGRLLAEGTPAEIAANKAVQKAYLGEHAE